MPERRTLKPAAKKPRGNYFIGPKTHRDFITTGSRLLDLSLGGGWAERRVANIIGDKSTGKTLLATEACTNFARKYKKGNIRYREFEHAFDFEYAKAINAPVDRMDFDDGMLTAEDIFNDLTKVAKGSKGEPELYIVDSWDSVTSEAEMARDIDEDSYGTEKARLLSQMFRRKIAEFDRANVTLIIISQIRDNIGAGPFAKKTKRSGGKALDFYSSQIVTLAQVEMLTQTRRGIKRPTGITVKAMIDKNKVGLAHRSVEFSLMFGYGIDDVKNCLEFIAEAISGVEANDKLKLKDGLGWDLKKEGITKYRKLLEELDDTEYWRHVSAIHAITEKLWYIVEADFIPKRQKYT
jgi:protein RecA